MVKKEGVPKYDRTILCSVAQRNKIHPFDFHIPSVCYIRLASGAARSATISATLAATISGCNRLFYTSTPDYK